MTRYLIVGGSGFIGRHLAYFLALRGGAVTIADRIRPPVPRETFSAVSVAFEDMDLATADWDRLIASAEVIHHCAWSSVPATAQEDPVADLSNQRFTLQLLEAARRAGGKRVVFASSGGTVYGPTAKYPADETSATRPASIYGAGKLAIENYMRAYHAANWVDCRVARIANPFGAGQNNSAQGLVSAFVLKALRSEPVAIWGDGHVVRDYIHIQDVVRGMAAIGDAPSSAGDLPIYNIGSGRGISINEIVAEIQDRLQCTLTIERKASRGFDVPVSYLDISRASRELGWAPVLSLAKGIDLMISDLKAGNLFYSRLRALRRLSGAFIRRSIRTSNLALGSIPYTESSISGLLAAGEIDPLRVSTVRVFEEKAVARPREILEGAEAFTPDWIVAFHKMDYPPQSFGVNCYFVDGLEVSGIGHTYIDGRLLMSSELVPSYWRHALLEFGLPNIPEERALPERRLTGLCIVFMGWGESTYGHFLIEMLPRLLVAHRALGERFSGAAMLLPANAARWLLPMIEAVFGEGTPPVEWYDPAAERILVDKAILPALPSVDSWFHPDLAGCLKWARDRLGGEIGRSLAEKIFLTRALFSNPKSEQRRCRNELRLAEIAACEFGYTVLALETFSWPAQITLLASADIIVGEFGSALHGALFAKPGTIVGAIGFLNLTQTTIGAFGQHRNAYLECGPRDEAGNFEVDEDAFRGFLGAIAAQVAKAKN